jgi:hypothetical protein
MGDSTTVHPLPDHCAVNASAQFVLGYGSLAAEHGGCPIAVLHGWRRVWGAAMDNSIDVPGYKSYRLRSDGSRPAAFVCFLDIEPDPAGAVTGVCMPVDEPGLRELDDRERNYDRVDVSAQVASAPGRVWAYVGSAAGRARLREGLASGRAVISRDYRDAALTAIAAIAPGEAAEMRRASTEGGLAVVSLQRIDL